MRNSLYSLTIDEALSEVGRHNKYQKVLIIGMFIVLLVYKMYLISLQLLMIEPEVRWLRDSGQWETCDDYCDRPYEIVPTTPTSFTQDFGLLCEMEYVRTSILNFNYIGLISGGILLSWIGSHVGRKPIFSVGHLIFVVFVLMQITCSISAQFFAMFTGLASFGIGGAEISWYLMVMEVMGAEFRTSYGALLFMHWGLAYVLVTASLGILSSWIWVFVWILGLSVPFLYTVLTCVESPRFLAACMGKFHEARKALRHIAAVNKKPYFRGMLEGETLIGYAEEQQLPEPDEKNDISTGSLRGEFSYIPTMAGYVSVSQADSKEKVNYSYIHLWMPSIRIKFYIAIFLWFAVYLCHGFVETQLKLGLDDNLLFGYINGGIQLGATLFSIWLVGSLGRLGALTFYFTLSGVLCILSVAFITPVHDSDEARIAKIVHLVAVIIILFILFGALYVSFLVTIELFPTVVRMFALGSLFGIGRFALLLEPYALDTSNFINLDPMFISGMFVVIWGWLVCLLPETVGLRLTEYLEELQRDDLDESDSPIVNVEEAENQEKEQRDPKEEEKERSDEEAEEDEPLAP